MSVITAALAGVGVAASILCPVAVALSRAAWLRGVRRGYSNARRTYEQDVTETAAVIIRKAMAARPAPHLGTYPGAKG